MNGTLATLALCLVLGSLAPSAHVAQDEPTQVALRGELRDRAAIAAMRDERSAQLPQAEADAGQDASKVPFLDARRAEIEGLDLLVQQMTLVDEAPRLVEGLQQDLERHRERTTEARVASESEVDVGKADDAGLAEAEAALRAATQARVQAEAVAAAKQDELRLRQNSVAELAGKIVTAEEAHESLRQELERAVEEDLSVRDRLERQVLTAEARLRILELERDAHGRLVELDSLERDVAAARLEFSRAEESRVERRATAVRVAHRKNLEQAAIDAAAAAEAAREAAQEQTTPLGRALGELTALESELGGRLAQALAQRTDLEQQSQDLGRILSEVQARNERLRELFPEDVELEGWRLDQLREEQSRLQRRFRQLEGWQREFIAPLPEVLRNASRARLEMERLLDGITGRERLFEVDDPERRGSQTPHARWALAEAEFERGRSELSGAPLETHLRDRAEITQRLTETTTTLRREYEEQLSFGSRLGELSDAVEEQLVERERFLVRLAFWLRDPPPLSPDELRRSLGEFRELVELGAQAPRSGLRAAREAVPSSIEGWTLRLGALAVSAALIAFALFVRHRIHRTLSTTKPDPELPVTGRVLAALSAAAAPPLAVALVLSWCWQSFGPREPLLIAGVAAALVWFGFGVAHALLHTLFHPESGVLSGRCSEETAQAAHRIGRGLFCVVAVLVPVGWGLRQLGMPRLATGADLVVGAIALILGVRLLLRRDIMEVLLPGGDGVIARTLRMAALWVGPVALLYFAGVYGMRLAGYRAAAWLLFSRSLLCIAVLIAGAVLHQVLDRFVLRKLDPTRDEHDRETEPDDLHGEGEMVGVGALVARLLRLMLLAALVMLTGIGLSLVLELNAEDWARISSVGIFPDENGRAQLSLGHSVQAAVIFVVMLFFARYVRDALRYALRRRMDRGPRYVLRTLAYYSILAIGGFLALGSLGLDLDQFGWFLTAAGLGIGFGLQELISNFMSGLILFFERPVQVGDVITVGDVEGDVTRINFRSTVVRTRDGISIIIPNKRLITEEVVNWSHGQQRTRLQVNVSVAYGSDVALVKRLLSEVADKEGRILRNPKPEVQFIEFGESELVFRIFAWLPTPDPTLRRRVLSDVNSSIDATFRRAGVEIPFPQRDLHLRTWPASLGQGGEPGDDEEDEDAPARRDEG